MGRLSYDVSALTAKCSITFTGQSLILSLWRKTAAVAKNDTDESGESEQNIKVCLL